MPKTTYFNRDISWLSFNGRVLEEAAATTVPVIERIRFLSIYSSNLDEFYRVRVPVIKALKKIGKKNDDIDADEQESILQQASDIVLLQQKRFGEILTQQLIPQLKTNGINLLYNGKLPQSLEKEITDYFLSEVLAFLQPVTLDANTTFFPENNKLYFVIQLRDAAGDEKLTLLNIPSDNLPRFFVTKCDDEQFICFLDDIVRFNLSKLFKDEQLGCYSIKITRDAELDLKDEYPGELSEQIEKQLLKRDNGLATRFLYQADMPLSMLQLVVQHLGLQNAGSIEGGRYHNLKDLSGFPVNNPGLVYDRWPAIALPVTNDEPLVNTMARQDLLVNTPYQSYHTILRFFNEAANNPDVEEINVTLYRVASDSRIVNALISAARNGKKVNVVVELKARFDEANNLKWAKKMKNAGVSIIYSVTALKVHAKVALVKTRKGDRIIYSGLLATGNFNEGTAKFYTDHILLTTNHKLLREVELLFIFLAKRDKPDKNNQIKFNHLLVAGFNLQTRFLELIDREMKLAKQGLAASIIIKLNNLEEQVLIDKLYKASQAGVKIQLIVRSICCLVPGIQGLSENITIKRIVDRYLEHGRIFIFNNNNKPEIFMGSADWMNRNIYHRIEVCFPVYDDAIKQQITTLVNLQLNDNVQAVVIDSKLNHIKPAINGDAVQSQKAIYQYLTSIK
ncbi:polyphosphate kinase 1 [Mucilaginibacter phyllosphaerae]|uniref:Polyphosphate kinase n=1 Tax=Mucilaginibacter phyllosphaerae TaxID=1812349 RepID=A0A4Y8AHY5_9SPHI|nr:polyphosphate kinase 1 [Mucilaginibacter phyllosphaerae]MBB3968300.1 polyphosphate kinase [Mucilaginibacter phyllosphaerae]TEW68698.1 polyphosphate kinase 1 [Mucilaginibacter phyllosphaerae]GGG99867.1 polyphosphate kinase [Mucilaginibacter phyllosphaerae]